MLATDFTLDDRFNQVVLLPVSPKGHAWVMQNGPPVARRLGYMIFDAWQAQGLVGFLAEQGFDVISTGEYA